MELDTQKHATHMKQKQQLVGIWVHKCEFMGVFTLVKKSGYHLFCALYVGSNSAEPREKQRNWTHISMPHTHEKEVVNRYLVAQV